MGTDQVSRLKLRDLTTKLYGLRSDIAHGNKVNTVKEQELHELEVITREVINYALSNRGTFNLLKDFKKSIDEKKYQ